MTLASLSFGSFSVASSPFAPYLLVILAAFIHATWNLLAKCAASAGAAFIFANGLVTTVVYAPWVALVVANGEVRWSWPVILCIALSGALHLGYSICLQKGYQRAAFSVVYPVARGTGPMLSAIGAIFLLGETPTELRILGLVMVVAGIGLIATQGNLSAFREPSAQTGIFWGLVTGGMIAAYTVVDAYGVKQLGIHPVLLDWMGNLLRMMMLAPLVLANPGRARTAMTGFWPLALGVGVLAPLSYILVLGALNLGAPLSVVAPMREMSMMVGAVFGMVLLKEDVGRWRFIGCAVLIFGVVMLSLG